MADPTGTENHRRSMKRKKHPTPPRSANDKQKKSPRRRRRQRIPVLRHINPKNAWEDSKKTYNPSKDFIKNPNTLMKDPEKHELINSVNINVVSHVLDNV